MVSDEYSTDVTHNVGYPRGERGTERFQLQKLDIDVVHVLRWRDGKVIEGRGAIFGDGTTEYDQFWSLAMSDREVTTSRAREDTHADHQHQVHRGRRRDATSRSSSSSRR